MLLPLKPICPASKVRRCGTNLIFLQYCKNESDKTLLNTEIAIPPKFWHRKLQRIQTNLPPEYGDAKSLNEEVYRMFGAAEKIIEFAISNKLPDPVAFVKKTFNPAFDISDLQSLKPKDSIVVNMDFFSQMDDYIKSKTRQVSPKMINVFNNMRDTLKYFEKFRKKPISFDNIDYNFYEEFVEYMLYDHIHRRRKEVVKGFKLSTTGRNIKQLRIFLKNRMRKKIIPFIDLTDFKILDEECDAIYLAPEEINKIYTLDLSKKPWLQKYRDLLVLGCLTGLRFSDYSQIRPEDIRNGAIYKKQRKSDNWVVIPLRNHADQILHSKFNKCIPEITNPAFS